MKRLLDWLATMLGNNRPTETEAREARVVALEERTRNAVKAADRAIRREFDLAEATAAGDRRREDRGRTPDRRRVTT